MPNFFLQSTLYKGLFILILVFVALEYIYTRDSVFNATSSDQYFQKSPINYGPLLRAIMLKSQNQNASDISTAIQTHHVNPDIHLKRNNFNVNLTDLDYVITLPPFLIGSNVTSIYSEVEAATIISTIVEMNTEKAKNRTEIKNERKLAVCPDISQYLYGRVQIRKYPVPSVQTLENRFSWLKPGGHWAPPNCTVEKKVAIVIPFRCRGEHLLLFLQHMHPFLKKQQLDYTIFVLEQYGDGPFNRAMLMNIGYTEALKLRKYDCFIFHDVDLLPEDDRNLYTCPEQPRHMSVAIDMFKYRLPYPAIFGGVSAISTEHFKSVNGFSNSYWGWGGEDDDMSNRIRYHHLYISRYPITIARYTMLTHKKDSPNPNRYDLLRKGQKLFDKDGLSNLTYKLLMKKKKLLYTWIFVKLTPPPAS